MKHYAVRGFEPPQEEKKWGIHRTVGIVAKSAREALEIAEKLHPTTRWDGVNDCGDIHAASPDFYTT